MRHIIVWHPNFNNGNIKLLWNHLRYLTLYHRERYKFKRILHQYHTYSNVGDAHGSPVWSCCDLELLTKWIYKINHTEYAIQKLLFGAFFGNYTHVVAYILRYPGFANIIHDWYNEYCSYTILDDLFTRLYMDRTRHDLVLQLIYPLFLITDPERLQSIVSYIIYKASQTNCLHTFKFISRHFKPYMQKLNWKITLQSIIIQKHTRILRFLVKENVIDINKYVNYLIAKINARKSLKIIKYLCQFNVDIHTEKDNVLYQACLDADYRRIRFIIRYGGGLKNFNSGRALKAAIYEGNLDIVHYLCLQGAQLKDILHGKILVRTCTYNKLSSVKFLIEHGVDPNYNNEAPLKEACRHECLDIVKYLTRLGYP